MATARVASAGRARTEAVRARSLFGTDGVRGAVGELITAELALTLGRAAAEVAEESSPSVLIVRDTRESGPMLEAALAAGVAAAGGRALLGGILPTPACALLVTRLGLDLGAVVSASHNPFGDNGIKFFGADGRKLSDDEEARVEAALERDARSSNGSAPGRVEPLHGVAPEIFRRLGADVEVIAAAPDGRNINDGCGSMHVEALAGRTAAGDFDAGFAFDGDADRVLAADRRGAVVDGDELIALAAHHLRAGGRLPGNGVAVTVMTNYGFHG